MKEFKYALRYYAIVAFRTCLNLFHIFPIKQNRLVFYSFNGKQYSCSPRRVSEYLQKKYPGSYEIIWAFKDPQKAASVVPEGTRCVRYRSLRYYYYAKTAKVLVFNVEGFGELKRRKQQIFIQTWHASNGYKNRGNCTGYRRKLELLHHKDYSYVLSGAENMTMRRVRGSMNFSGPVIAGTPRMDVLINQDEPQLRDKVYRALQIDRDKKILLYAPTWRVNRNTSEYGMDYAVLKKSIEDRFGGDWIIAVRLHPNVRTGVNSDLPYVMDVTSYPDMQELLYVADVLISDYSSCIWDYSFMGRPCLLYCNDLEEYDPNKRFDFPIEDWHFPICRNMEELKETIHTFDMDEFLKEMDKHHSEMGNLEDGKATQRVCSLIQKICR
jgi:CDP-glycerol glycerophosphotransferase